MATYNENIELFKCYVRASHFTKEEKDKNTFHKAYAFAIQSVAGKILTFHIMTDYGMLRSRVPISEIFMEIPKNDIPSDFKQLWDCFSENVCVITYDYLYEKRCQVVLKDGNKIWATYLMTVDWYRNPYSDEPSDYKCGHILIADDGYLLCQPNNRIFWKDSNWVTKDFPVEPKSFKVDNHIESVEAKSDRWVSSDSDCYYYDIKGTKETISADEASKFYDEGVTKLTVGGREIELTDAQKILLDNTIIQKGINSVEVKVLLMDFANQSRAELQKDGSIKQVNLNKNKKLKKRGADNYPPTKDTIKLKQRQKAV